MTLTLVAGSASTALAAAIGTALGSEPCARGLTRFADGELHVEMLESVRGHDVYVIQSTSPPVDEHLMELLLLGDACRRAGAERLTAVVPYFGYARQDRRRSGREAVGAALAAALIEAAGFSRVVSVDLHAPEIEGFFRIPLDHLTAVPLLARALPAPEADAVVVAPDLGAVRLAERYQSIWHLPLVLLHKTRVSGTDVLMHSTIGEAGGRTPIVVDDMISTAGTIEAAVTHLVAAGCRPGVTVVATHLLCVGPAAARLERLPVRQLYGTNSVGAGTPIPARTISIDLSPLLADAIHRLHEGHSLEPVLSRL